MSEKNLNFHRLAEKRIENIEEAFRIFSNLSGPSYERSPDEVMAYFVRIDAARDQALARFQEQKWWRDAGGPREMTGFFNNLTPEQQEATLAYDGPDAIVEQPEAPVVADDFDPNARNKDHAWFEQREQRRTTGITAIIEEARSKGGEIENLATQLYLAQQVIDDQQRQLNELRGLARPARKDQGAHKGDDQEDQLKEPA